jgi:hypothetical protein
MFAANKTTIGVFVSRYPRSIPVDADIVKTAGAAILRTMRNCIAYVLASGPVMDVPMTWRRGCPNAMRVNERTDPKPNAKLNA